MITRTSSMMFAAWKVNVTVLRSAEISMLSSLLAQHAMSSPRAPFRFSAVGYAVPNAPSVSPVSRVASSTWIPMMSESNVMVPLVEQKLVDTTPAGRSQCSR
jgi:hypothetical protein